MDIKMFFTIFITVFVAEMADKTQIATLLYASSGEQSRILVFLASSLALIVTTAIAVAFGTIISHWIESRIMTLIAGTCFILVGIWFLLKGWI